MRRLLPLLPFLIFFALASVFYVSIGRDTTLVANGMVGKLFPDFELQKLVSDDQFEGKAFDRATLQSTLTPNKPWLLNVWASWCPQCYVEHGFIEALARSGVQVVGLNYKDTYEKGLGFLQKMGDPYHLVLVDKLGTLGLDLGVSGAPETYLIAYDGKILVRHAGALDRAVWDQKFAPLWQQESGSALLDQTQGENK